MGQAWVTMQAPLWEAGEATWRNELQVPPCGTKWMSLKKKKSENSTSPRAQHPGPALVWLGSEGCSALLSQKDPRRGWLKLEI